MKTDIYDFDKTMLPFDSGSAFWAFCLVHYPWTVLLVPFQGVCGLLMFLKIISLTKVKKFFFAFVSFIPLEKAVKKFWDKNDKYIFEWAKKENRPGNTVVISASPDFLLGEIAEREQFDCLICTRHDAKGAVIGKNCKGEEKVRRFRELFPDAEVERVFSDSLKHDEPIFSLGEHCYHIVKGERIEFDYSQTYGKESRRGK